MKKESILVIISEFLFNPKMYEDMDYLLIGNELPDYIEGVKNYINYMDYYSGDAPEYETFKTTLDNLKFKEEVEKRIKDYKKVIVHINCNDVEAIEVGALFINDICKKNKQECKVIIAKPFKSVADKDRIKIFNSNIRKLEKECSNVYVYESERIIKHIDKNKVSALRVFEMVNIILLEIIKTDFKGDIDTLEDKAIKEVKERWD